MHPLEEPKCDDVKYNMEMTKDNKGEIENSSRQRWEHPGGKLVEIGPASLSDAELLAILISTGIKGRPAEKIASDILNRFGSFRGMANHPLSKFLEIKGLGDVKIIRIAAAFEIARRIVKEVLREKEEQN